MAEHHSPCLGKYTPQIALFSRNRSVPSVRTVQIGEGALRNDVTDPKVYLCRRSYTSSASVSGSRDPRSQTGIGGLPGAKSYGGHAAIPPDLRPLRGQIMKRVSPRQNRWSPRLNSMVC